MSKNYSNPILSEAFGDIKKAKEILSLFFQKNTKIGYINSFFCFLLHLRKKRLLRDTHVNSFLNKSDFHALIKKSGLSSSSNYSSLIYEKFSNNLINHFLQFSPLTIEGFVEIEEKIDDFESFYDADDLVPGFEDFQKKSINRSIQREDYLYPQFEEVINIFKNLNQDAIDNYYSEIFEKVLYFSSKINYLEKNNSMLPVEIIELSKLFFSEINPKKNNISIYNPFSGFASFSTIFSQKNDTELYFQESDEFSVFLSEMRCFSLDLNKINFSCSSVIDNYNPGNKKYDFIITFPPIKILDDDLNNLIDNCINNLNQSGKILIFCKSSFLYTDNKKSKKLRKKIIESNLLDCVLSFPVNLLKGSSSGFNLLMLSKSKTKETIKFYDGTTDYKINEFGRRIFNFESFGLFKNNLKNISNNVVLSDSDYILNPNRYIFEINKEKLHSPVNFIQFSKITTPIKFDFKHVLSHRSKVKIVSVQNVVSSPVLRSSMLESSPNILSERYISEDCVLICFSKGKLHFSRFKYTNEPVFLREPIWAYKIKSEYNFDFVFEEFKKDYIDVQVKKYITDSFLRNRDLEKIQINIPPKDVQEKAIQKYYRDFFNFYEDSVSPMSSSIFKESKNEKNFFESFSEHAVSSKGLDNLWGNQKEEIEKDQRESILHSTGHYRATITAAIQIIDRFIKNQTNKQIFKKFNDLFREETGLAFKYVVENINSSFMSMNSLIESSDDSQLTKSKKVSIVLSELILAVRTWVRGTPYKNFNTEFNSNISQEYLDSWALNGNLDIFQHLIRNVLTNAGDHAFDAYPENKHKNRLIASCRVDPDESEFVLTITNNGKPMVLSKEQFVRKYNSNLENSGRGGYDINNYTNFHGGRFEINSKNNYVSFVFYFPIEKI